MSPKRCFVVDLMALFFRSHHALMRHPLTAPNGFPTSALFGCAKFFEKLIREQRPTHLLVLSDSEGVTFRHALEPLYKAHRGEMPEELLIQLPVLFKMLEAWGIDVLKIPGVEADDLFASVVQHPEALRDEGLEFILVSQDKDLFQLLGPRVHWFALTPKGGGKRGVVEKADVVEETFGCDPEQIPDYLALVGDPVDGISGVPGIGPKGALGILGEYGSLEGFFRAHETPPKQAAKSAVKALWAHRKEVLHALELTTLRPVPISWDLSRWEIGRVSENAPGLQKLFGKLGFSGFISASETEGQESVESDLEPLKRWQHLKQCLGMPQDDNKERCVLWDTGLCSFATDKEPSISAAFLKISLWWGSDQELQTFFFSFEDLKQVSEGGDVLLCDSGAVCRSWKWVTWDLKEQLTRLETLQLGLCPAGTLSSAEDVMLQGYLLRPGGDVSFRGLCSAVLEHWQNEKKGSRLLALWKEQNRLLDEEYLRDLYAQVDLPLAQLLKRMQDTGVLLETEVFQTLSQAMRTEVQQLEKEAYALAGGQTFLLNSPKQLQKILFEDLRLQEVLGVRRIKKNKSGYSTDASVLELLSDHPLPRLLLEHRSLTKLLNTYLEVLPEKIRPSTGRIHTTFHQALTATARLSSSNPNLQNIPLRGPWGERFRQAFVSRDDEHVLISADYEHMELRLLAHFSEDPQLIKSFLAGGDLHRDIAALVFEKDPNEVTAAERSQAKTLNYGLIYGMGAQKFADTVKVSLKQARSFMGAYFERFSGVKQFLEKTQAKAENQGGVRTLGGRWLFVSGFSGNWREQAHALNTAVNYLIQGSAADVMRLVLLSLDYERSKMAPLNWDILLQIHDEWLLETTKDQAPAVIKRVKACMEAIPLKVPLKVKAGLGRSWWEAHL